MRRQFLLSPYKDVIDDILVIVIIGDKDAVYDILARDDGRHKDIVLGCPWRQSRRATSVLPPQETVSSAALGVVRVRQKDKRENTEGKDVPPFHGSNKDRPAYLSPHFRIVVNSIIVNNFAPVNIIFAKKLIFSLLLF